MTDRAVPDTSVFIAAEPGPPLDTTNLPAELALSVVTLAELRAGVLAARDTAMRAVRLTTLESVETGRRLTVNDLWVAATAASRGPAVVTQDDDFDAVEGMAGLVVVRARAFASSAGLRHRTQCRGSASARSQGTAAWSSAHAASASPRR